MTIIPTHSNLRSKLESKQFEDVYVLLEKHYTKCRKRLSNLQITGSPSYQCTFGETQVKWLGALLNAWSLSNKINQIPLFFKKYSSFPLTPTLRQLGLDRHEVLRVKTSLKILTLSSRPQAAYSELEELAIRCGEMSKCQLCEYAHITTNYSTEEMQFRACLENSKIEAPILGECSLFLKRGLVDEQDVA